MVSGTYSLEMMISGRCTGSTTWKNTVFCSLLGRKLRVFISANF